MSKKRMARPEGKSYDRGMIERIETICKYIRAHSDEALTLQRLGRESGLSPFYLQRSFKAATGVTPKQYQEGCRLQTLKAGIRASERITDAIYAAGFGSSSRVYERVDTRLGMVPAEYRAGGKGVSISYVAADSGIGRMMVGATDRGICFVQFADGDDELLELLRKEYPAAELQAMAQPFPEQFRLWMELLGRHMSGQQPDLQLPLDVRATAFQLKVWRFLQSIPYGEVYSYAEVAKKIGQPSAARAVASACARNRVALAIPCHRVIRGDGGLGGYKWGLPRKRALLDRERSAYRTKP